MEEITTEESQDVVIDKKFWEYFDLKIENNQPIMTLNFNESNASDTSDVTVIAAPEHGFVLIVYSVLLVIGAFGNVAVFTSLVRSRRRKSRVNLLMTHLVVADIIVIFFVIPLEVSLSSINTRVDAVKIKV